MKQVNIVADAEVTHAMVDKKLVAFRWRSGDQWHVGAPGYPPCSFNEEQDSVDEFMRIALGRQP